MDIIGDIREFCQGLLKGSGTEHGTAYYTPTPLMNPGAPAFNRFADLLPYLSWMEDEQLFLLEGSEELKVVGIGFCLEMTPQTGASPDMADMLSTIFQYMPGGTSVQWTLLATPLIDDFLDRYVGIRTDPEAVPLGAEKEKAFLYRELAVKQARHFADGAMSPIVPHTPFLLRKYRIVMSVVVPESRYEDPERLQEVVSLRDTCVTALKTFYQFDKIWSPTDLINWCASVLNPVETFLKRETPDNRYDDGRPISRQIIYPDTVMRPTENGLLYGLPQHDSEIVARCLSVRKFPPACTLHAMGDIIGDYMQPAIGYSTPFMITLCATTQEFEKTRAITQMKAARATQKSESPMARFQPTLKDEKRDWDIAQRAFDEGKGTLKIFHQIVLWAKPLDLAKAEQAAQSVWRNRQFDVVTDTYMQVQGLLSTLPMAMTTVLQDDIKAAHRWSTKTVFNAVNMAPLIAEWRGVGDPVLALWGRRGQATSLDLFANTGGNFNGCVVGTSGSGKSVLLNSIALGYLSIGGRVWIIDIGRSYEKMCRTVGGQYIEFTSTSDISLNPFSMVEDIDEDMEMLVALFAQMMSPSQPLEPYQLRQLGIHVQSVWYDYGAEATIDHLAYSLINNCEKGGPNPRAGKPGDDDSEWVQMIRDMPYEERQQYCDPRIRDLGVQLFPYSSDGPYGRYFQGQANINFDNAFIVLELEELASKPDLQTVVMYLLMYRITQDMYLAPRGQRKVVIMDEAWSLLKGGASGEFIEGGYRKARKYGGSFLTGTQGIGDYGMSKAAEAAFNNADWMLLMRQKPESVLALEKSDRLVIDEHMRDMLLSVKTQQGAYSEVFIHAGQMGSGVARLLLDPFTLLMMSSKAEDFEAVQHYKARGYTTRQALEAVLADRKVPGYRHPNFH